MEDFGERWSNRPRADETSYLCLSGKEGRMANLDVRLLGGFEVRLGSGQKVTLSTRKAEALLAYLAFAPGKARSRDQLAGLLWSDRADTQAKSSLRQALTALRHGLQGSGATVLTTEGERA